MIADLISRAELIAHITGFGLCIGIGTYQQFLDLSDGRRLY